MIGWIIVIVSIPTAIALGVMGGFAIYYDKVPRLLVAAVVGVTMATTIAHDLLKLGLWMVDP